MSSRIETSDAQALRHGRQRGILCRLTYEVTPSTNGLFRWFLLGLRSWSEGNFARAGQPEPCCEEENFVG
jgi:hypothetical protein